MGFRQLQSRLDAGLDGWMGLAVVEVEKVSVGLMKRRIQWWVKAEQGSLTFRKDVAHYPEVLTIVVK